MDIFEAIRNRRSIRKYDDAKQVPKELIEKVVDAARWAPSAGNHQPIEVVVVSDQKKREKMAEISGYARYLKYSPIALVARALTSKDLNTCTENLDVNTTVPKMRQLPLKTLCLQQQH